MSFQTPQISGYRIIRLLGSGRMGEVYLAEDIRNPQQLVVLKRLRTDSQPETVQFFEHDARIIARLSHPHILPLLDYGQEMVNGTLVSYVVMPYCADGSLATWLQERGPNGTFLLEDIAHFTHQLAAGLQYAHDNGVVHLDVKPSNVFISRQPNGLPDVMLSEFSIAKMAPDILSTGQALQGTPAYMAPEQWEGQAVPASDQYALAVLVYQLLTGHPPFQGDPEELMDKHLNTQPVPLSRINSSLSPQLDAVVLRGLAKVPGDRFVTVSAFADAFEQALIPGPAPPEPVPNAKRSMPTSTRVLALILALLVLGGGALLLYTSAKNTLTSAANVTATAQVYISSTKQARTHASNTAAAHARATITTQANATSTAKANINATSTARVVANAMATATMQANTTATVMRVMLLDGHWVNNDASTHGITRLNISNTGLTVLVQTFAWCTPTDCDWGSRSGLYTGSPFTVDFNLGTRNNHLLISSNNPDGSQLKVIDFSTSNGGQTYYFHRAF
ncbi:MAG: serine/threonine protein kinase [Ktedonobacteraceae bacterium]